MSHLLALGTAVPPYAYDQTEAVSFMTRLLGWQDYRQVRKLRVLFKQTQIKRRHSVLADFRLNGEARRLFAESEDLRPLPDIEQRMEIFRAEAPRLAAEAAQNCLKKVENQIAELNQSITHIITVSCTGLYAPGLEQDLVVRLGLQPDVTRFAVNFIGCYAAFHALKLANYICNADPKANVLIVSVELCSLHFQEIPDADNLTAAALFSDGAAAALVAGEDISHGLSHKLSLSSFETMILPEGKQDMSWELGKDGFLMRLSAYIPQLVKTGIGPVVMKILEKLWLEPQTIDHWCIHPGGRRILEVCEEELPLKENALSASYSVLGQYGNMSSATILFVLEKIWQEQLRWEQGEKLFLTGFGPGLTIEAGVMEVES